MSSRRPRAERVSFYRRLPLWFQWALPSVIAIAVVVVVVVFVADHQSPPGSEATITPQGEKSLNAIAVKTMQQQQQPHTVKLPAGLPPNRAMERAISSWIDGQYAKTGAWGSNVRRATCDTVTGHSSAGRIALTCTVAFAHQSASDASNSFVGVVEPRRGSLTYCMKIVYPPGYGEKPVPVSPACT